MKQFFISLLAVIVGGIILSIIPIIIIISIVALASSEQEPLVKDNSLLVLDLSTEIADRSVGDPSVILRSALGEETSQTIGLLEVLNNLEKAAVDDRIKGILIKGESSATSIPTMTEVRDALSKFKECGKPIYYFSTTTTQSALYLASIADKVFITPEGEAQIYGLTASVTFYKDILEKLGIDVQITRHGKYKSAVEPYFLNKMSDASREQLQKYVDVAWNEVRSGIAQSRGIEPNVIDEFADTYNFYDAKAALNAHLVDSLIYYDQFLDYLRNRFNLEDEIPSISMNKYINVNVAADINVNLFAENSIAVVYATGEINDGSNSSVYTDIFADDLAKTIREVRTDTTVKAIVLRVNSPGGSALASDIIWREVAQAKKTKPVIVSMGNYAASGGYYISCCADEIVAEPATLTGSIGVFGAIPTIKKSLDKIGISTDKVTSNKNGNISIEDPLTDTQCQYMQNIVERIYTTFTGRCAEGRNTTAEKIDEIGQGRVWSGADAKSINLVDRFGGLKDAILLAAEKAGIDNENYTIDEFPKIDDPVALMLSQLTTNTKAFIGSVLFDSKTIEQIQNIKTFVTDKPCAYTRMEYNIEVQ